MPRKTRSENPLPYHSDPYDHTDGEDAALHESLSRFVLQSLTQVHQAKMQSIENEQQEQRAEQENIAKIRAKLNESPLLIEARNVIASKELNALITTLWMSFRLTDTQVAPQRLKRGLQQLRGRQNEQSTQEIDRAFPGLVTPDYNPVTELLKLATHKPHHQAAMAEILQNENRKYLLELVTALHAQLQTVSQPKSPQSFTIGVLTSFEVKFTKPLQIKTADNTIIVNVGTYHPHPLLGKTPASYQLAIDIYVNQPGREHQDCRVLDLEGAFKFLSECIHDNLTDEERAELHARSKFQAE